jgi:hypothetical protein
MTRLGQMFNMVELSMELEFFFHPNSNHDLIYMFILSELFSWITDLFQGLSGPRISTASVEIMVKHSDLGCLVFSRVDIGRTEVHGKTITVGLVCSDCVDAGYINVYC